MDYTLARRHLTRTTTPAAPAEWRPLNGANHTIARRARATCNHRPRFKRAPGALLAIPLRRPRPIVCCRKLLALTSFLALAAHFHFNATPARPFVIISTISCDLLLIEQSPGNQAARANSNALAAVSSGGGANPFAAAWRDRRARRKRRHLSAASPAADAAIATQERDAGLKVAALASKLDQWLQCQRLNLMQQLEDNRRRLAAEEEERARQLQQAEVDVKPPAPPQANARASQSLGRPSRQAVAAAAAPPIETQATSAAATTTTTTAKPTTTTAGGKWAPPPTCRAHFDGHLCWPAARAGQRQQLACPKLNYAPGGQQAAGLKSVIDQTGGAIDQPLESAAAAAGESEAGDEPSRRAGAADKFARRLCSGAQLANETIGQWQPAADYGECAAAGGLESRPLFDPTDEWVKLEHEDRKLFESLTAQLERIEVSIDPYLEPDLLEQWQLCIGEIVRQQERQAVEGPGEGEGEARQCPIIFDGWRCWPATRAGEVAYVSCPSNQPGFSAERKAHKICTLEADWYRHPMTNRYWSNYTTCVDTVDLAFRTKILNLYIIGNLISLIALTMSLIIFVSFKSLKCTRVTIHKNLFLSFITNNLMWVVWYTYVVNDANLLQSNPLGCRFWHILLHYFLVSNYFWMFCEGLYLHTILVVAFVSEDKILKWFYLLGWLTPIPITLAYAYNRWFDDYYTNFCWMEESPHNIILMAPIGVSLLLNLVFLINIVRVLVTKLRANNSPDTHQTRKAVRATLILIPLLGLHYMLTPFRPEAKSEWEVIYEIIAAVCTSFQGLCVAMLFCFCNGEVMSAIEKKLRDSCQLLRPRAHSDKHLGARQPPMRSRSNTAVSNLFNYSHHQHFGPAPIATNGNSTTSQGLERSASSPPPPPPLLLPSDNEKGDLITLNQHNSPPWPARQAGGARASPTRRSSGGNGSTASGQQVQQHKWPKLAPDETTCLGEETIKLLQRHERGQDQEVALGNNNNNNNNNNNSNINNNDELAPANEPRPIVT